MHDRLISLAEVQRRLGIGRTLANELLTDGVLPRVKIGRATRIPLTSVIELARRGTARPAGAAA